MASLQQAVTENFFLTLTNDGAFDQGKIERLETLIKDGKKIKPADLVEIFNLPEGGEIE